MLIDAHQHFWLMKDRAGQWPPPALAAIYRDFLPADLSPLLAEAGVSGTVLVQTMETAADTDFMLELADKTGFIKGVVGWVDMKSPDAATEIARRAKHSAFRGVRPMLQGIEDVAWIDDPALDTAVDALVKHGLVFDALVLPPNLPHLLSFARRHPQLPVVIDHGAKPLIATGHYSGWRSDMAALAALPNVHCKLSGLLTERGDQRPEAVRPYADDGNQDLQGFVKDGTLAGIVVQGSYQMGEKGVETITKLINKEKVEKFVDTGVVVVTKDNVDKPEAKNVLY